MIIRLPSSCEKYIGFTHITVSNVLIDSIRPEAQFLFANLTDLIFGESEGMTIAYHKSPPFPFEALISMIDLFASGGSKLEYIKFDLGNFKKTGDQLKQLVSHPIKSVVLSSAYAGTKKVNSENKSNGDEKQGSGCGDDEEDKDGRIRLKTFLHEMGANFKDLEEIKISSNEIQSLDGKMFEPFSNLEILNLSDNHIFSIQPNSFVNATKLTHLDLSSSNFECLTEDLFSGLVNLKSLNLSGSKLQEIHPLAFNRLANLEDLDLSRSTGLSTMSKLPNWPATLTWLNLAQCGLTQVDPHSFDNIVALDTLDLSVNSIKEFELAGCAPRIIDLSRNGLTSIKFSMNSDLLAQIEQLHLTKNKLTSLNLAGLVNLDLLDVSNNQLKALDLSKCSPRVVIANVNNLTNFVISDGSRIEKLNLANNNLQNSVNSMFRTDFARLTELTLYLNRINKLEAGVFAQMRGLKKLTISNNPICELSAEAFRGLHSLEELTMSLKWIFCLKPGMFKDLSVLKKLELLHVDGNFFSHTKFP
jgi:Leucine-rich repeat (LRR) protein